MRRLVVKVLKNETILVVASILALISCFIVPPDKEYAGYIHASTISQLICLMLVVCGFQRIGVFRIIGSRLLHHVKTARGLVLTLIALPFFSGMLITNDVALVTFVPFAIAVLTMAHMEEHAVLVGTLMTNYALERRFGELGVSFVRAKVGDRYVLEELKRNGWLFGGESSGHILALDRQTTGDGIVSALQVLSAMRRSGRSLAELTADLQLLPQVLVNKRIPAGYDWQNDRDFSRTVEACRTEVEGRGRVLIRPSGTEPLLRIMVEADDAYLAAELTSRMAESLSVEHQA